MQLYLCTGMRVKPVQGQCGLAGQPPAKQYGRHALCSTSMTLHQSFSLFAEVQGIWAGELYFLKKQAIAGMLPGLGMLDCATLDRRLLRRMEPHCMYGQGRAACFRSCLCATGAARDRITYPAPGNDPHASSQTALEALRKEVALPLGGAAGAVAAGGLGSALSTRCAAHQPVTRTYAKPGPIQQSSQV